MGNFLIKIAKELNVGTATLVDFLNHNGFEIENKPNAKVTDEMYTRLLKEFQKSIDDKEKSKQINIGTRAKTGEPDLVTTTREKPHADLP